LRNIIVSRRAIFSAPPLVSCQRRLLAGLGGKAWGLAMGKTLTDAQREAVYRIRRKRPQADGLFKHLAGYKIRIKETSLNVVETHSGINKQGSLELMREIEETGLATIRGGGGGVASFLVWVDGVDIREVGSDTDTPLR
jgi:hypothetical protein